MQPDLLQWCGQDINTEFIGGGSLILNCRKCHNVAVYVLSNEKNARGKKVIANITTVITIL